jgi:hypothetical protein
MPPRACTMYAIRPFGVRVTDQLLLFIEPYLAVVVDCHVPVNCANNFAGRQTVASLPVALLHLKI